MFCPCLKFTTKFPSNLIGLNRSRDVIVFIRGMTLSANTAGVFGENSRTDSTRPRKSL